MSDDYAEVEAWYSAGEELGLETIRIASGPFDDRKVIDLDIRDAVFLRYQLDGAIQDYERAVGK
jgi:hypothetical protein